MYLIKLRSPQLIRGKLNIEDYQELAEILAKIKADFILSINDHSEIRAIFERFNIQPVSLNYTVSKGKQTKGKELMVSNF